MEAFKLKTLDDLLDAPEERVELIEGAIVPDWVCEIVSPGHERKDTLTLFLLLQRHQVAYYWLIWPEDRSLTAWRLDGEGARDACRLGVAPRTESAGFLAGSPTTRLEAGLAACGWRMRARPSSAAAWAIH